MHAEVVLAFHASVHHETHREGRLLARLEDHRTDGRDRRSAALDDFYEGFLAKAQGYVASIRQLESRIHGWRGTSPKSITS
jgi:hypothetical protein